MIVSTQIEELSQSEHSYITTTWIKKYKIVSIPEVPLVLRDQFFLFLNCI